MLSDSPARVMSSPGSPQKTLSIFWSYFFTDALQAVLSNWRKEFQKWAPSMDVVLYDGPPEERRVLRTDHLERGTFNVLITHYDLVMRDKAVLRKVGF